MQSLSGWQQSYEYTLWDCDWSQFLHCGQVGSQMSSKIPSDHQLRLRLSLIEPLLAGSTCHPQQLSPSSLSNPPLSVTELVTLQPLTCSPTIFQNRLIDIACYFTNSPFRPDILGWQGISQSCKQIDKSQLPDQIEQQFFLQSSFVLYDWTL